MKLLVCIQPPNQSSDHVKRKKRWDPTVDHFDFHHWFRTSNVFPTNMCPNQVSLVVRSGLGPDSHSAVGKAWVWVAFVQTEAQPPSKVLQKCICSLLFHCGKGFACSFFDYVMKNYVHVPLESPCARLQLEDTFPLSHE